MTTNSEPDKEERLAHLQHVQAKFDMLTAGFKLLGGVIDKLPGLFGQTGQAAEKADEKAGGLLGTLANIARVSFTHVTSTLKGFVHEAASAESQVRRMQLVMDTSAKTIVDNKWRPVSDPNARIRQAHQLAEWYQEKTEKFAGNSFLTGDEASAATTRMMSLSNQLGHATMAQRVEAGIRMAEVTKAIVPGADAAAQGAEIQAVITGEGLETSQVAKRLGLKKEELAAARQHGDLVQLILSRSQRLEAIRQQAFSDYNVQSSLFQSRIQGLQAAMGGGLTQNLARGIAAFNRMLASKDVTTFSKQVGKSLGDASHAFITPVSGMMVQLGPRLARLGSGLLGSLGPSLQRLAVSAARFTTTFGPMLVSLAEKLMPIVAEALGWLMDKVSLFLDFLTAHPGLTAFGASLLAAFRIGGIVSSLITLRGVVQTVIGVFRGVSAIYGAWERLIGLLGRVRNLFTALRGLAGTLSAFGPHAAIAMGGAAAIYGAYQWSKARKEQQDLAHHEAVSGAEARKSRQLRLAQTSGLAQRLFAGQATDADRHMLYRFDPSVQAHLRNHVLRERAKPQQVHAPITTGAITLPPGSLIDERKVMTMIADAQAKQQKELLRQVRNGSRSTNPGAAYA